MDNLNSHFANQAPETPDHEYDNKELSKSIGSKSLDAADAGEYPNDYHEDIIEDNGVVHELTVSDIENISPKIRNNPDLFARYLMFGTTDRQAIDEHLGNKVRMPNFYFSVPASNEEQVLTNIDTLFEANPDTDVQDLMDSLPEAFVVDYIGSFAKHGADAAEVFSGLSPDMLKRILRQPHYSAFKEFGRLDHERDVQQSEKVPNRPGRLPFRK